MRTIDCGVSGVNRMPMTHRFSELPVLEALRGAVQDVFGGDRALRVAQERAFFDARITETDSNVLLTTPTNSGKSLVSYIALLTEAIKGHRVVLVEPLRVLAGEKGNELKALAESLRGRGGPKVRVDITTGDYRTTGDFLHTTPVEGNGGQIVVATPERLDAISRDPTNGTWMKGVSFVCVDEAHTIGDHRRGATLELLLAYFRSLPTPPRLLLMSATIANPRLLADWLAPCIVIDSVERYPRLAKSVCALESGERADEILLDRLEELLRERPDASALCFLGSRAATEKATWDFVRRIGGAPIPRTRDLDIAVQYGAAWFHAGLSEATKRRIHDAVLRGEVKTVFTTTALSMGVNLPATHVFIRDLSIGGGEDAKALDPADILQMLGRAGRGDTDGVGTVFVKDASANVLAEALREERMPEIASRFSPPPEREGWYGRPREYPYYFDAVASQVLGLVARTGPSTVGNLEAILSRTLGGNDLPDLGGILDRLSWSEWHLTWHEPETDEWHLTRLGECAARNYLPPRTAARIGGLVRALMADSLSKPEGNIAAHLLGMTVLDWLIVLCAAAPELKPPMRWRNDLPDFLNREIERSVVKSRLYNLWIKSEPEILYSTICFDAENDVRANRRKMILSALTALLLLRLSLGHDLKGLEESYGVDVGELQEKLRDNAIWMLSGLIGLLVSKNFYHAAKELLEDEDFTSDEPFEKRVRPFNWFFDGRKAGRDPVTGRTEPSIEKASSPLFSLIEKLKFRSELGTLVYGCRSMFPTAPRHPGEAVIRRLEENGITSLHGLVDKSLSDLVALGIPEDLSNLVFSYIRRRLQ